ncbi:MAG: aldehyde-activating protein [Rhodocyclaceae bacterium]|nr:aldehyde-activating protein [Rhodocyclaceae bacterium]
MKIEGGCHCGDVRFTLDWGGEPTEIPARACDCSFCQKHGGLWTSSPAGSLEVRVRAGALGEPYRFGTGTAAFHVCRHCGVVPVVSSEIDGQTYAVVSVRAMQDVPAGLIRESPASFGSEDVASRLSRRTRGWIPRVRFVDTD